MPKKLVFGRGLSAPIHDRRIRRGDIIKYGDYYYIIIDLQLGKIRSQDNIKCLEIKRGDPVWEWWQYPDPSKIQITIIMLEYDYELMASCTKKMSWYKYVPWFINTWTQKVPDSDLFG